jgi:hypothetical protein
MIGVRVYPSHTLTDEDGAIWVHVLTRFRRHPADMKTLLRNSMLVDWSDRLAMLRRTCYRMAFRQCEKAVLEAAADRSRGAAVGIIQSSRVH